jgi:DNA end-binding protein Ku
MATRGRDYVVAIKPCGDGLLLETLRYADEIRKSDKIFSSIPEVKINREMHQLATELIERKSAPFDASVFKSQYVNAMRELLEEKRKSGSVSVAAGEDAEGRSGEVIDLMAALKKSVAKGKNSGRNKSKKKGATSKKKTSRRTSSKRAAG